MITILKKEIHSGKIPQEFKSILESKTLKTNKVISIMNATNMIENDKDFYGKYENDTLSVTRIRRLSLLRILPKLIIEFPTIESSKKFHVKLGFFTFLLVLFFVIYILSGLYEFLSANRFTEDFMFILIFTGVFIGLIWIEFKMYEQKFKNY